MDINCFYFKVMEPVVEFYFEHGDAEFLSKFDHYSVKDYLHLRGNLTLGAIELIGGYTRSKMAP